MEKIYNKQVEFQKILKNDISTQSFKNQMFLGLFEETAELMKETPFKLHKKNQEFNRENFLKECVDIQLYLVNLLISTGINWKEFEELLMEKQTVNFKRQEEDY